MSASCQSCGAVKPVTTWCASCGYGLRDRQCVTHHMACDCRERRFAEIGRILFRVRRFAETQKYVSGKQLLEVTAGLVDDQGVV